MNAFVDFVLLVLEQQNNLAPMDRAFFWLLVYLCVLITIILITIAVIHILDVVHWLVNQVHAHLKWRKERKFFQQINKIKNESYGANRNPQRR